VGGLFAAAAAWAVGKVTLGLRSDYLAIATLGISEIIIAVLKNEDWLARGVKNVIGMPRPVPYEVDLRETAWVQNLAGDLGMSVIDVLLDHREALLRLPVHVVLLIILFLSERALNSPWGRMMRAIRDNEVSAEAMGKDVKGAPPAGLHPRFGRHRHCRCHADHHRRPVHPAPTSRCASPS
jgi:branched-chain amino acid transport system permease protein